MLDEFDLECAPKTGRKLPPSENGLTGGYFETDFSLSFLNTKDDVEIDLIVSRPGKKKLLVEIKSSREVRQDHLTKFLALGKDIPNSELICLCREERIRKLGGITIMPWREAFRTIFQR